MDVLLKRNYIKNMVKSSSKKLCESESEIIDIFIINEIKRYINILDNLKLSTSDYRFELDATPCKLILKNSIQSNSIIRNCLLVC